MLKLAHLEYARTSADGAIAPAHMFPVLNRKLCHTIIAGKKSLDWGTSIHSWVLFLFIREVVVEDDRVRESFSSWRSEFNPKKIHMEFVVYKMKLWQEFLKILQFPVPIIKSTNIPVSQLPSRADKRPYQKPSTKVLTSSKQNNVINKKFWKKLIAYCLLLHIDYLI